MSYTMDPFGHTFGSHLINKIDRNFMFYQQLLAKQVIKSDVMLSSVRQTIIDSTVGHQKPDDPMADEDYYDLKDGFEMFLDDLCAKESPNLIVGQSDASFGCVCCDSCQMKSKEFMNKTNKMLDDFREQLMALKTSVRQELSQINGHLNETRMKFTKLLMDLQIKVNDKNYKLDKVLDMSSLLSQTNDYLINQTKQKTTIVDKVCKENIEYRNRLGIDLRVALNRNECEVYLKQQTKRKKRKRLLDLNIDNVINDVVSNHIKNETIDTTDQTVMQSIATMSVPVVKTEPIDEVMHPLSTQYLFAEQPQPLLLRPDGSGDGPRVTDPIITTTSTLTSTPLNATSSVFSSNNKRTYSLSHRSPNKLKNGCFRHTIGPKSRSPKKSNNHRINNQNDYNINSQTVEQLTANLCHYFNKQNVMNNGEVVKKKHKEMSSDGSPQKSSQNSVNTVDKVGGEQYRPMSNGNHSQDNEKTNGFIKNYKMFCDKISPTK